MITQVSLKEKKVSSQVDEIERLKRIILNGQSLMLKYITDFTFNANAEYFEAIFGDNGKVLYECFKAMNNNVGAFYDSLNEVEKGMFNGYFASLMCF